MVLDDLSRRARSAIDLCLKGKDLSVESLRALSQSQLRSAPNVGAGTLKEIVAWAGKYGILLPRWR